MVIYIGGIAPRRFVILRSMAGCCQVVVNETLGLNQTGLIQFYSFPAYLSGKEKPYIRLYL